MPPTMLATDNLSNSASSALARSRPAAEMSGKLRDAHISDLALILASADPAAVEGFQSARRHAKARSVRDRKAIELFAGLSPRGKVLVQQGDEAFAVRGFNQVHHFMHDHVLKQVFRLLYELRI